MLQPSDEDDPDSKMADYNEQEELDQQHEPEELRHNEAPLGCSRSMTLRKQLSLKKNIYNAFFLLKNQNQNQPPQKATTYLIFYLGILSYFTILAQYVALGSLMFLIVNDDDEYKTKWAVSILDYHRQKCFVFPFLVFGVIYISNLARKQYFDFRACSPITWHRIVFYLFEYVLTWFGSLAYLTIVTVFSPIQKWSDVKTFVMLLWSYKFIIEFDSWVFQFFAQNKLNNYLTRQSHAMQRNKKKLFESYLEISKTFRPDNALWGKFEDIGIVIFHAVVILSCLFYSSAYFMMVVVVTASVIFRAIFIGVRQCVQKERASLNFV